MSEPIRAAYSLEPTMVRTMLASHQSMAKYPFRGAVGFVILAGLCSLTPGLIFMMALNPVSVLRVSILRELLLVVAVFWLLLWVTRPNNALRRWGLRRQLSAMTPDQRQHRFEFSPAEVRGTSRQITSIYPWSAFRRLAETSAGYLLYLDDIQFLWLPPAAFDSADDMARFAELAKSQVAHYVVSEPCRFRERTGP